MERRKTSIPKPSPLPSDYLKMISEVFTSHFDAGLQILQKSMPNPRFIAQGEVHANEIVVAVSLLSSDQLAATTIYASSDFDPKASAPSVQDLLAACVDAIGSIFGSLLAPDKPEAIAGLAEESLSALENVPFEWTEMESDQKRVFVKIDKANLEVDALTEEWLEKNDPDFKEKVEQEQKKTESLFFTGPKTKPGTKTGSGITH